MLKTSGHKIIWLEFSTKFRKRINKNDEHIWSEHEIYLQVVCSQISKMEQINGNENKILNAADFPSFIYRLHLLITFS